MKQSSDLYISTPSSYNIVKKLISLRHMRLKGNPLVALSTEDEHLFNGPAVDAFWWLIVNTSVHHPLYCGFKDVMDPTNGFAHFYQELEDAHISYGSCAQSRTLSLWQIVHQPKIMQPLLKRFASGYTQAPTIIDGLFPFVAMHANVMELHNDPLWMAWWLSPNGAKMMGGSEVLENLCLSGQAHPIPEFIKRSSDVPQFFEDMSWDTIIKRQIFNGVAELSKHITCDVGDIMQRKNLIPLLGISLLDRPKRWDKIVGPWCNHREDYMTTTAVAWVARNIARERRFLFFQDPFKQEWCELQRRGLAPHINLKDLQKQLGDVVGVDLSLEEPPYEYRSDRSERIVTAAQTIIQNAVLSNILKNGVCETKNALPSRRKM